jgi:spore coat protein A, manganese oxidase
MFSVLRKVLKLTVPVALIALLASPSLAQLSLRRALDYDGDNRADFSVFRPSTGTWYIQQSTAGFTSAFFGDTNTDFPCPGDYDGDGRGDVCVWRDTNGFFYFIRSSNNTIGAQQWGTAGDEPVSRQWDGDAGGRTDFAVVRRSNNQLFWYVLTNPATGAGQVLSTQWGASGDFVIPGDYDGDGRFDYAVQRPTSTAPNTPSNVFILKSGGGFDLLTYGFGTDFFVPGDYDGDSKTDLAVVRETGSSLIWYIRNSNNNPNGNVTAVSFGATGTDFTVQNDYDGDGRTDVAVWRETNSTFYILGSQSGFRSFPWGISADFPIASYDTH